MSLYELRNGELFFDSTPKSCPETTPILTPGKVHGTVQSVFFPCRQSCAKFELMPNPRNVSKQIATLHCCKASYELSSNSVSPVISPLSN
jgi:hypothetical protein